MDLEIREALEKLELEKDMLLGEEPKVEEHFAEEVSVDGEEWVEKPDTETSINKELLEREQQLIKLNKKLDIKSKRTFRLTEQAVKCSKVLLDTPTKKLVDSEEELTPKPPKPKIPPVHQEDEQEHGVGSETTIRFLKARVNVLTSQLTELMNRDSNASTLEGKVKTLDEENSKMSKQIVSLQSQVEKHKRSADIAIQEKSSLETQLQSIQKELDSYKRAHKQSDAEMNTKELRLNRALEDLTKTKSLLAQYQSKKDGDLTTSRQEINHLKMEIKKLDKQKSDLISAFKKQMQLIDVLKRQKIHLEASRLLAFSEEEFLRCLDWNLDNK